MKLRLCFRFRIRKTRRKKKRKKKKFTSQIFRICSYLKEQLSSSLNCEIEQFDSNWAFSWQKSAIKTEICSDDKNTAASKHRNKILAIQQNHEENIIFFFLIHI